MEPGSFYFDLSGSGLGVFLGRTEARLMELAWDKSSLTVKSAMFHLDLENSRAYTTIMTILNRLTDKGLLQRTKDGRHYVYRPAGDRQTFVADRIARIQACLKRNFPEAFAEERR